MRSRAGERVALAFGGLIVLLLTAETLLRIAGVGSLVAFRGDPETAVQHVAGAEGWYRGEGEAYVRINSAGFRDAERTLSKPPGTTRVAVLGDGLVEALQVGDDQTFTAVAERELSACAALPGRVEVLNFGVSGYGTAQELILLRDRVLAYGPDIVVLAFNAGNDIMENSSEIASPGERPYFVLRDGGLVLDSAYRRYFGNQGSPLFDAYFWLLPRSRVLQVIQGARVALAERRWTTNDGPSTGDGSASEDFDLPAQLFREPTDPIWIRAWEVTERLLSEIRKSVSATGSQFFVLSIPADVELLPDRSARDAILRRLGVPDLSYVGSRLRRVGARDGFDVVPLEPVFSAYVESTGESLYGTASTQGRGHWNARAHRIVGRILAQQVCDRLSRPT